MKTAWDLSLYAMAIDEQQPASVLELGTGSGAHALWMADEARRKRGMPTVVHTLDRKSADEIATSHGLGADAWRQRLADRGVTFHGGADLIDARAALPSALLESLPHPWLIIEDAHVNTASVVRRLFRFMRPGDYLVVEDIRFATRKRQEWFSFLRECGDACALDLKYTDYFGVNLCGAPDGWLKKVGE